MNDAPTLARLVPAWTADIQDYPVALAWSPHGDALAVGGAAGRVFVLDGDGRHRYTIVAHDEGLLDLSWSRDGRLLATAGQDGCARLWQDGALHATVPGQSQWLERVAWSPDAEVLAVADGRTLVFRDADGVQLTACEPEAYTLLDMRWLPDGSLLTAAYGGVSRWRPGQPAPVARYPWKGALLALAPNRDGTRLAAGLQEAGVHYWHLDSGDELYMRGYATKVRELSWDPDGRYLATGGGASLVIWDCGGDGPAGTEPMVLDLHVKPIRALAFAPRGQAIASGSRDGSVVVLDPTATAPAATLLRNSEVTGLAWRPDASRVVFAFADGHLAACPGAMAA